MRHFIILVLCSLLYYLSGVLYSDRVALLSVLRRPRQAVRHDRLLRYRPPPRRQLEPELLLLGSHLGFDLVNDALLFLVLGLEEVFAFVTEVGVAITAAHLDDVVAVSVR